MYIFEENLSYNLKKKRQINKNLNNEKSTT